MCRTAVYNYAGLVVVIIKSVFLSASLLPSQSCCFGCFDINVTMTPPFLIRKAVPSCNGFWEHEPATAASDMPDFPPLPFSLDFLTLCPFSLFFLHLDLLFFFLLPPLYPVALALFVSCSFTFPPSFPLSLLPLSVLQGVGFSGSESCFALKNSLS